MNDTNENVKTNVRNHVADILQGMHESYVNGFDPMQNIYQKIGAYIGNILYDIAYQIDCTLGYFHFVLHYVLHLI